MSSTILLVRTTAWRLRRRAGVRLRALGRLFLLPHHLEDGVQLLTMNDNYLLSRLVQASADSQKQFPKYAPAGFAWWIEGTTCSRKMMMLEGGRGETIGRMNTP